MWEHMLDPSSLQMSSIYYLHCYTVTKSVLNILVMLIIKKPYAEKFALCNKKVQDNYIKICCDIAL